MIMAAPVKYTCPDIDAAQKSLKQMVRDAEYAIKRYEMDQSAQDTLSECINEMSNTIDVLEDLRRSNDALREWGNEMEKELNNAIIP